MTRLATGGSPTNKLKHGVLVGLTATTAPREYKAWRAMRARCLYPKHKSFRYYGGKGIGIDPQWDDFNTFYQDMGPCPFGWTLDRKQSDRDYGPDNCRWATQRQQVRHLPQNQKGYRHKTRHGRSR